MKSLPAAALLFTLASVPAQADDRALDLPIGDPARKDRQVSLVLDGITDTARGDVLTPPELAARLDGVKLLFVGESHTEMEFHKVQLRVIQELHERGRQVLVGLEMFPVTEQAALDRWHADKALAEDSFLRESGWYRNWGYHWNYYRDIFLFARQKGIRMFGVNLPRGVVQTVRMKGFEALTPEQRAMMPERIDVASEEHQQLFRALVGDAMHGMMRGSMFDAMFRAQCTWDAAMAWNAVRALKEHGREDAVMVVLIGAGHVAYGLGAERQAKLWFEGKVASVVPVPIGDDDHVELTEKLQASYANFVWGLPRATSPLYPTVGISTPEQKQGERYHVIMVTPDSPAQAAGFNLDDELVSIDGVPVTDKETSNRILSEKRWGDTATYEILRSGKPMKLTVQLRRKPPAAGKSKPEAAGDVAPASPSPAGRPTPPSTPPTSPGTAARGTR
jgi:uncharacterized iron-regulated protein